MKKKISEQIENELNKELCIKSMGFKTFSTTSYMYDDIRSNAYGNTASQFNKIDDILDNINTDNVELIENDSSLQILTFYAYESY